MKQTTKDIKKVQGGFSDIRLWPCYAVVSAFALFLIPRIGVGLSTIFIYTAVIFATKYAYPRMPVISIDYEAWKVDRDKALVNSSKIPDMADYEYMENKKVKAVKESRQKSHRLKIAMSRVLEA